jgi:uncharacterized protein
MSRRHCALVALLLSVPLTSIGALMTLLIAPRVVGQGILVIIQIWLLVLPVAWLRWVEHKPISISKPTRQDGLIGIILGLLMFVVILAAYWFLLRHWINVTHVRNTLQNINNVNQFTFLMGSVYITFINALIEEYFWRWFVFSRCEEIVPGRPAVLLSAFFFTIHHTIGLAVFTDWRTTILGTLGVFVAGVIWSECYRRYRSVWGNYISHAIADMALHIATWQILFG